MSTGFKSKFGKSVKPKKTIRVTELGTTKLLKKKPAAQKEQNVPPKLGIIRKYRDSLQTSNITSVHFSPVTDNIIKSTGNEIRSVFSGETIHFTVNDPRLGPYNRDYFCSSCEQNYEMCPGHTGFIDLGFKFFNPVYKPYAVKVLQCVCNTCSELLLDKETINDLTKASGYPRLKILAEKSVSAICRSGNCPKNPLFNVKTSANPRNINIIAQKQKEVFIIRPEEAFNIFNKLSKETIQLLGFKDGTTPKDYILTKIPVIPPCSRQSTYRDGKEKLNPITTLYEEIVKTIHNLNTAGVSDERVETFKSSILSIWADMIHTDNKNDLQKKTDFQSKVRGKKGIFRGSALGKRVNRAGRTPAGPGVLDFGYIYIPEDMAKSITITETATMYNINKVIEWAKNGVIKRIRKGSNAFAYTVGDPIPEIGTQYDRRMLDGDVIIINRQPTLHRASMISCKIIISQNNNIGAHLSITPGLNLDFDGDELNMHAVQGTLAQMEINMISNLSRNIISTHNSAPITGLVFNAITGAYLISLDDNISQEYVNKILSQINRSKDEIDEMIENMKQRVLRLKNNGIHVNMNSGKTVFSYSLPDGFWYSAKGIEVREGVLISGRLSKSTVGASANSLVQSIWKWYGEKYVSEFITLATYITNNYLTLYGLSVSIRDCMIEPSKKRKFDEIIEDVKKELDAANAIKSEEAMVTEIQKQTAVVNNATLENIYKDNAIIKMIDSGSKGKKTDLAKIAGPIGQQYINNQRPKKKISDGKRWLPTFSEDDKSAESRGFVWNSFYEGVTPNEFFALAQAGREGVADTALKTSETGEKNRDMTLSQENMTVAEDGSVRGISGEIIHYQFGFATNHLVQTDQGYNFFDPKELEGKINAESEFYNISYKDLLKIY